MGPSCYNLHFYYACNAASNAKRPGQSELGVDLSAERRGLKSEEALVHSPQDKVRAQRRLSAQGGSPFILEAKAGHMGFGHGVGL